MRYMHSAGLLALLVACGTGPEDFRELRDGQREIREKLTELDKKLDQLAARAATAPQAAAQADPNKVFTIPVGNSASKGPANASVILVEFSDFQ